MNSEIGMTVNKSEMSFTPTRHQIIDGALADLVGLEEKPIDEQIIILTKTVDTLSAVLSSSRDMNQTPIPGLSQR